MPFKQMKFRHPWRPYQQRVLDAIHEHLDDQRLHIVAAPGAGKTSLGLEVFRILGKPTLILSPTRVIRDQWIHRLRDFCALDDSTQPDWASNAVSASNLLTSITYQSLYAKFTDDLDVPDLVLDEAKGLKPEQLSRLIRTIEENSIEVLILDEAHHLRAEWWRALDKVCSHFPEMTLVSLTATPPYDSTASEWAKYEQLCGPIDEEISIPELVTVGTLCPHQDYIWACDATESEKKQIEAFDHRVSNLCDTLIQSELFGNYSALVNQLIKTQADRDGINGFPLKASLITS